MSITEVDLSNYVRVARYDLPLPNSSDTSLLASEASAVTYNWDTDTLFVVGDGGTSIVQVTKTGQLINSMALASGESPQGTTFYDTEGLTYIGNGQFVMTEERDRQVVKFTYTADTTLTRADVSTVDLGTNIGNTGLEGVTYDPLTGGFIFVKEKTPEGIIQTAIDFTAHTATNGSATTVDSVNLFDPAKVGTSDFSDVFSLSLIPSLAGQADASHLLVLSQEAGKVVEVDRAGNVLSTLNITGDADNSLSVQDMTMEGVVMDKDGNLYIVNENGGPDSATGNGPQLWVYAPSSAVNHSPTALALNNQVNAIAENTDTATRIKVANVQITDDGLGTNNFAVTGADAAFFEVDNTGLYIKAGTHLDFETKQSYAVTVTVDDQSVGATPDANANFTLSVTDVALETPAHSQLIISEVAPWSSGNGVGLSADWFEVTNTGTTAIDITGWKVDDNSDNPNAALALRGITSIAPGESVIFIESANLATAKINFENLWFGGNAPSGLQIGSYSGSGVGLSTDGDHVNLYNSSGELQTGVAFGASSTGTFPTFDNWAGVSTTTTPITQLSVNGVHGAQAAGADIKEIGSPGFAGKLYISEVAAWSSGNSPLKADWFEVTNSTGFDIDITNWRMDDNSQSFNLGAKLNGINTIHSGESVIFIESSDLAGARAAFSGLWFGGNAPAGLQIGAYSGSGVGLSGDNDQVNLYAANGVLQTSVAFGASPGASPFATFENPEAVTNINTPLTQPSAIGVRGGTTAANDVNEIGSPGATVNPAVNAAPTAVAPINPKTSIPENTSTATHIKVADVLITDDGHGSNNLSLSGADAAFFEVDSTGLYIKAGTTFDFENKQSYAVTVNVNDPTVGGTPDASANFNLSVSDVINEGGAPTLFISEVAPWSSGNAPAFGRDWFEVTNTGTTAIDITGWKVDDNSDNPNAALALRGITSIAPGESVIFMETSAADGLAAAKAAFIDLWFGGNARAGLQIGNYSGSGIGLSSDGDHVNLFDSHGVLQANVTFGASSAGPNFATFANDAGLNNAALTGLSVVGDNGAFVAAADPHETGSPGVQTGVINDKPIFTSSASFNIAENQTAVGAVAAVDPEHDSLTFGLAGGDDKDFFVIDSHTGAFRFVASPDFETRADANHDNVYDLTVSATDNLGHVAMQTVQVHVTDVTEIGKTFAGGNGNDALAGTNGNDTMTGANGDDALNGGDGNDTISGGNGNDVLLGGRGDDVLDGTNGNDVLDGGAGNNRLSGGNGDDRLMVGTGDNLLTGGNGNDTFVFSPGLGKNVVTDFSHGDVIEFGGGVFANFAAVQAAMHMEGNDAVIGLDAAHSITLQGVSANSLHPSDFLFV